MDAYALACDHMRAWNLVATLLAAGMDITNTEFRAVSDTRVALVAALDAPVAAGLAVAA